MMHESFVEHLLIVIVVGTFAGTICRQLSCSPLLGYLLTGVLIGETGLQWVPAGIEELTHLAELGVFFLLFSIGLELSLEELRKLGRFLFVGGAAQMLLVFLPVASFMFFFLHYSWQVSFLAGTAAAFSSTVLVFKSLGEIGKTTTGEGRRTLSILLFQDAALVPLLLLIPFLAMENVHQESRLFLLGKLFIVSLIFIGMVLVLRSLLRKWVIPRITQHRSPDLVLLLTLAVLGSVCLVAYRVGLPAAIGAFAAGLVFGGNRWSAQIDSLILPFREVFAALFFVSLGLMIDVTVFMEYPVQLCLAVVGLLVVKIIAGLVSFLTTGLSVRAGARFSLGLAHVGEFSFVVILAGLSAGLISSEEQKILFGIFGVTLFVAPNLIRFAFSSTENSSDEQNTNTEKSKRIPKKRDCVVIGMGPVGHAVASKLDTLGFHITVIDQNPLNTQQFAQLGFPTISGDAAEQNVLLNAGVDQASLLVICVPEDITSLGIIKKCRSLNQHALIIVRCRYSAQKNEFEKAGANHVLSEEAELSQKLVQSLEALIT